MDAPATGSFDNEAAGDWVADLADTGELALLIEEALGQAAPGQEYVEIYDGQRAVAAAEVVAAMCDGDRSGLPEAVIPALADTTAPAPQVIEMAQDAVERVAAAGSGLADAWAGTDGEAAWHAGLARLRARLTAPGGS